MTDRVSWKFLFKEEFEQRIAERPTVYLPVGICEPHGHIAVLGLDTVKAEYLCKRAAAKFGGIVAPTLEYQIHESGYHAPWLADVAGNVKMYLTGMPPEPLLYFFLYQLRCFYNAGFKVAIIITGHAGGNQKDFRLVADLFEQATGMKVIVKSDPELTRGKYEGDHAGRYEISQLMYLNPDMVDITRAERWVKVDTETRFAQGEDAGEATAELGKQIIDCCLEGIGKIVQSFRPQADRQSEAPMSYTETEKIWSKVKSRKNEWVTNKLAAGQKPLAESSFWKQFEAGI